MAWTETDKAEALALVDKKKEELGSVRGACNGASSKSGIPAETIRRWWRARVSNENAQDSTVVSEFQKFWRKMGRRLDMLVEGEGRGGELADDDRVVAQELIHYFRRVISWLEPRANVQPTVVSLVTGDTAEGTNEREMLAHESENGESDNEFETCEESNGAHARLVLWLSEAYPNDEKLR